MTQKELHIKLYKLMDYLLTNKLNPWDFCNQYEIVYCTQIDYSILTENEHKYFGELSTVAGRFSDNEEDKIKYPKAYFYKEDLLKQVNLTVEKLKEERKEILKLKE